MPKTTECEVLFAPDSEELRFLPEGPYSLNDGSISWVGIQHGGDSKVGSINVLNLDARTNQSFELPGRPGFAFPTSNAAEFVCGVERQLGLFNTSTNEWKVLADNIDSGVDNTIINDGLVCDGGLIFGCKELEFKTKKAGLYLYRSSDQSLVQLRSDQICSNGKALLGEGNNLQLIDIDSPDKQATISDIDLSAGTLSNSRVIVDVTSEDIFPDGLLLTPDGNSVIIAFYDPGEPEFGVARQYSIASGEVEAVWTCPGSPRVTCPQLVSTSDGIKLVLTTAVEGMEPDMRARHPNAGCLFIGDTSFDAVSDQPVFQA